MRIGFFGDGPWAVLSLQAVLDLPNVEVPFVVGRWPSPDSVLRDVADEQKIPFFAVKDVNSTRFLREIETFEANLFVSVSYDQIFRREALGLPSRGIINCHAGKLPFYRGRNVLNWALINDEKEFGITVHYVDEGVDTGDIILQESFPISDEDDYRSLLHRAYSGCSDVLLKAISQLLEGSAKRTRQSDIHPTGSFCSLRCEGDELINWNQPSRRIFNFIRALSPPGPCAKTRLRGLEVEVKSAQYIGEAPEYIGVPGSVLAVESSHFLVKTSDTFLRILECSAGEVIRVGDRFQ